MDAYQSYQNGISKMSDSVLEDIKEAYAQFVEYYRKGVERFGVWWTVFTFSVLSIPLILIVFAILAIILFL
jgi:hypothetical protein